MATEWKVIRVASEVVDDLQTVRKAMRYSHELSLLCVDYTPNGNITDNSVVKYLIRHYQKHAERRARSTLKRRAQREGSRGEETVVSGDGGSVNGDSGGRSSGQGDALGLPDGTLAEPAGPSQCPQHGQVGMPILLPQLA